MRPHLSLTSLASLMAGATGGIVGCADSTREGFANRSAFPRIAACAANVVGVSVNDGPDNICEAGWHVCTGSDIGFGGGQFDHFTAVTFAAATSFPGRFVYNAMNNCGLCHAQCGPVGGGGGGGCQVLEGAENVACMGSGCVVSTGVGPNNSACIADAKLKSRNDGCTVQPNNHIDGLVCCIDGYTTSASPTTASPAQPPRTATPAAATTAPTASPTASPSAAAIQPASSSAGGVRAEVLAPILVVAVFLIFGLGIWVGQYRSRRNGAAQRGTGRDATTNPTTAPPGGADGIGTIGDGDGWAVKGHNLPLATTDPRATNPAFRQEPPAPPPEYEAVEMSGAAYELPPGEGAPGSAGAYATSVPPMALGVGLHGGGTPVMLDDNNYVAPLGAYAVCNDVPVEEVPDTPHSAGRESGAYTTMQHLTEGTATDATLHRGGSPVHPALVTGRSAVVDLTASSTDPISRFRDHGPVPATLGPTGSIRRVNPAYGQVLSYPDGRPVSAQSYQYEDIERGGGGHPPPLESLPEYAGTDVMEKVAGAAV
mmetsp:Transcript_21219/g.55345  ORF Transcript_21219/g.55345 Transcript_21219/m.55345 type:complete len:541 (+) Transcript_21219:219-1841(+)